MTFLDRVHSEWLEALANATSDIERIERALEDREFLPPANQVLHALEYPLSKVRVVIFGQDPYPTPGHAMGLAFSVAPNVKPLPMSLRNIFTELSEDVGCAIPKHGDLTKWSEQGVALINRTLTVPIGHSNGHLGIGWEKITNEIARILGESDVVAILWGNNARQLEHFFRDGWHISGVHPSPLSARRGFFGSKPFSRANKILLENGLDEINW